ncbi:MAG TPA: polysaccharide deacetylase family protein [Bryobacteraceae bacterium]|nr:polysaccharide deacetylase family protein [Bryobacteraceae bacterium]
MPQVSLTRTKAPDTTPRPRPGEVESIFSIDVEDWYHILQVPGTPAIHLWDLLPSCVERDFMRLLDLMSERGVHATCFFLGWVARRFPSLVHEAVARGHEIASHGFAHRLVFQMTARRFREDSVSARCILEDLAGCPVRGYRAAGFSVIDRTPWFFETLLEAGYEYDSSVFPAARQHGGISTARRAPYRLVGDWGELIEFPISVADAYPRAFCFFGGGYLRLFPLWLIRRMAHKVRAEARPVIYYVHPREINPDHPRLRMPLHRRFKSYVNLRTTEPKVAGILSEFPMITFQEYIKRYGDSLEQSNV